MKVVMYNWAHEKMDLPSWFLHNEEADVSWDQIKELYDAGINVMMQHRGDRSILFVDTKRFGQR